jgi:sugar phosphate isomerase/epimerase
MDRQTLDRRMLDRRTFLGAGAMAAAAVLAPRLTWAAESHRIEKVGVQLYTVRDDMKRDFDGTIAKVASIGYKEVEFAGYFDHTPQQVRATLDHNGLVAPSVHVDYKSLGDRFPQVIADSKVIGHQYIVNPWIDDDIRKDPDGWKRAAEVFNKCGEACKKAGLQFAYHNHHFEFIQVHGKYAYDILLEETDPKLVQMEMDLCWITIARQDPMKYFARYPGRVPMVHVKDVKVVPPVEKPGEPVDFEKVFPQLTSVGDGVIDWKKIFEHSKEAGIKHYFVENDYPKKSFEDIRASYEYLEKLRWSA